MDGERRVEFLKAEAERLIDRLNEIDSELVRLCGHNGFVDRIALERSKGGENKKPKGG